MGVMTVREHSQCIQGVSKNDAKCLWFEAKDIKIINILNLRKNQQC